MSKTATPGSVSHGTMRPEDLIPRFTETLRNLDPMKAVRVERQYDDEYQMLADGEPADTGGHDELVARLMELLDEHAPDGHMFGSHPGDGSDYGFWLIEEV